MLAIVRPAAGLLEELVERDPGGIGIALRLTADVGWLAVDEGERQRALNNPSRLSKPKIDAACSLLPTVALVAIDQLRPEDDVWTFASPAEMRNGLMESPLGLMAREPGFVVDGGCGPTELERKLRRLLRFQRSAEIYDGYLLPRLIESRERGDFWQTLIWFGSLLAKYGNPTVTNRLTLRGIVARDVPGPAWEEARRLRKLPPDLATQLREIANELTHSTGVLVSIDVRGELTRTPPWYHGRYLTLDDRWVVTSDRGFDFMTGARWTREAQPNEFVRWFPRLFPSRRVRGQYETLEHWVTSPLT